MARRRRQKRDWDKARGIIFLIIGLALIGALGGAWYWVGKNRTRLDAASNCPVTGPTAIHVILIDRSDPIQPLQAQQARQTIDRYVKNAKIGERFDLYTANGDAGNVLSAVASVCNPGRGDQANELYQNPQMIQRQFEEQVPQAPGVEPGRAAQERNGQGIADPREHPGRRRRLLRLSRRQYDTAADDDHLRSRAAHRIAFAVQDRRQLRRPGEASGMAIAAGQSQGSKGGGSLFAPRRCKARQCPYPKSRPPEVLGRRVLCQWRRSRTGWREHYPPIAFRSAISRQSEVTQCHPM